VGAQVAQGADTEAAQSFEQAVQDLDGRPRVGQCAVVRGDRGPEEGRERGQAAVGHLLAVQDGPRQADGVDDDPGRPGPVGRGAPRMQETDIERCVVRYEDRAADELQQRREDGGQRRRGHQHCVGEPGQPGDVGRHAHARVDQRRELAENFAPTDLHRTDLGDPVRRR